MPDSPPPFAALSRFERFAYWVARFKNRRFKRLLSCYQRYLLGPWFRLAIGRAKTEGLEHVRALPQGTSILLVSNHRSFFDFFATSRSARPSSTSAGSAW
jgi:1-acyl-sn-glycerol-3-phosphate acyltransferase